MKFLRVFFVYRFEGDQVGWAGDDFTPIRFRPQCNVEKEKNKSFYGAQNANFFPDLNLMKDHIKLIRRTK